MERPYHPITLLLCSISYQILVLESFVILIQTSSYLALKLAVVNGALLTEGHNYGTTLPPNYLTALFDKLSDISVRELRNTNTDLNLPSIKTCNGQRCFAYSGAQLWNNLSAEVKKAPTLSRLKSAYKNSK